MRRTVRYIALIAAFLAISGCITGSYKKKYHPDDIPSVTKQYLQGMFRNVLHPEVEKQCKSAYQINQMQLIWLNSREPGQLFTQYLQQLYTLQDEGIDLGKLNINLIGRIHNQLTRWYDNQVSIPLDSIVIWDMELTKSYITAAYLLTFGDKKEVFRNDILNQQENFRAADNLIFSVHQSDAFPALDIYRPQHFLYVQMVFALKNWMVLSGDKEYMSLKNKIRHDSCSTAEIWTVIKKEMGSLQSEDTVNLVLKYQAKHSLPQTGMLDAATLLSLKTSPEDYRRKLKINMERLRLFSNTFPEEYFWYDIVSKKFHFVQSGKIIYESNVNSSSPLVYDAPLFFRDDSSAARSPAATALKAVLRSDGTINVEGIYKDTSFREVFTLENTQYLVGSIRDPLYAGQHPADPPAFSFYKVYLTIGQDAENNVLKYLDDVLQWDNTGYSF